jgi:hypothetical protein
MKKNILAENMRRFKTKNLNEDEDQNNNGYPDGTETSYYGETRDVENEFKIKNTPGVYLVKDLFNKHDYDPMTDKTEWLSYSAGAPRQLGVGRMKRYMQQNPSNGKFTYYIVTIYKKSGGNEYGTTRYTSFLRDE